MSGEVLGLILLGALLAGIFAGFPIAFTLIILSVVCGSFGLGEGGVYVLGCGGGAGGSPRTPSPRPGERARPSDA